MQLAVSRKFCTTLNKACTSYRPQERIAHGNLSLDMSWQHWILTVDILNFAGITYDQSHMTLALELQLDLKHDSRDASDFAKKHQCQNCSEKLALATTRQRQRRLMTFINLFTSIVAVAAAV